MFIKSKIISNLSGLVGYQNPANPDYQIVDSTNQLSSSGRHFTENAYCKIEYIKKMHDYARISDSAFNDHLTKLNQEAITTVIDRVFDESDFLDRQVLFKYPNNKINTEDFPNDSLVVYRISQSTEKNLAIKISRVLLEFQGTGTIHLMLFNSFVNDPIEEKDIEITSSMQIEDLNWIVNNSDNFYKGDLLLGYRPTALTGNLKPYKREYENSDIMSVIEELIIDRGYYPNITDNTIPDLKDFDSSAECWGLNPDIIVYEDFTDFIIQNKSQFERAIQLQGQINIIGHILATRRSNPDERISKETIKNMIVELEGINVEDGIKKNGIKKELFFELTRIKKEINKLQTNYLSKGLIINTNT